MIKNEFNEFYDTIIFNIYTNFEKCRDIFQNKEIDIFETKYIEVNVT